MAAADADGAWAQAEWPAGASWDSGQKMDSGDTLLPWATSAGHGGAQAGVPSAKAPKHRGGRAEPSSRPEPGPPSNLASRVALRNQLRASAEETMGEAEHHVGPYHFRPDDAFPDSSHRSQDFLVTKRVDRPPSKLPQGSPRCGRAAEEAQGIPASSKLPPNLQLHRDGQHESSADDAGGAGAQMRVHAAGIAPRTGASTEPPKRARTTGAATTSVLDNLAGAPETLGKSLALEEDESLQRTSPYMLHTREPALSRTWLQDAQDRNQRARGGGQEVQKHPAAVRLSRSPLRGSGVESETQLGAVNSSTIPAVPASVFVQPVVLERCREKAKELEREKARGAMLQGNAVAFESPSPATPLRKESRLRAMLRQAKGRQAQHMPTSSAASSQDTPSFQQTLSSPVMSASLGDDKTQETADDALQPVVEESSHESCASNPPMTPVEAVVVCRVDPNKRKQKRLGPRKAARAQLTEPFASVRLESQRQQRMEASMEHAADKIATVVSRSSVATTQILTSIGGALEGCSIDKLSKTQARASLMDSGHGSETDAQINSDRRGNEEIGPGEEKLSLVRGNDSSSKMDLAESGILTTQKAAIEDRRQIVATTKGQINMAENAQAAESENTSVECAETRGQREDILVYSKSGKEDALVVDKLPIPDAVRCRRGPTDSELEKEVVGYLIKTESARDRHQREKEDLETRRLDARILGEDPEVLHKAVATGVQGLSKPARPKVALGSRKAKERTYLGKGKEHSITADLTKLLGQNQYLRDESILQAEEIYIKEVEATRERVKAQEDVVAADLPDLPQGDASVTGSAKGETTIRPKSAPRVGTVRRVPRPSSARPVDAAENTDGSSFRHESAIGRRRGGMGTSSSLCRTTQRPASAPPKRASDSPNLTSKLAATIAVGLEQTAPALQSSDVVLQQARATQLPAAGDSEAREGNASVPAASERGSCGETMNESHLSPLDSVLGKSLAESSQSQRKRDIVVLEGESMWTFTMQSQYNDRQCMLKRKLLGEVSTANKEWNSEARKSLRLEQISAIEQDRQDVQTRMHDTHYHRNTFLERTYKINPAESKADARFLSSLNTSRATCQTPTQPKDSRTENEGGGCVEENDYLRNRILAAHLFSAGRATAPVPVQVSGDEEDHYTEHMEQEEVVRIGRSPPQVGSISPGRRGGSSSPARRQSGRSPSPLVRSRGGASIRAGDYIRCEQDEEKRQVRESQEAIVQILGLPSQAQAADETRQQLEGNAAMDMEMSDATDRVSSKIRGIAPVVFRTLHSVVTGRGLTTYEERRQDKDRLKGKGLSTPFGKPMEAVGFNLEEMVHSLEQMEHQVVSTEFHDLQPAITYDGLHTTSCAGTVHATPDHDDYPHSIIYSYDMAKTKGPLHKSHSGLSTRMLMVLMVNLSGDADMVIRANKLESQSAPEASDEENGGDDAENKPDDSWRATRYWGTLADAGFDGNDPRVANVLNGRTFHYASWVIIHPDDPLYVNAHKVDYEALLAEVALEQDLSKRVKRRKELEAEMARGVQLAEPSTFYITVTGTLEKCDFAILTRTIFQNEVPNPKLQRYISEKVTQNDKIYKTLKLTSMRCSELRLRFGQHGISVRKFFHYDGLSDVDLRKRIQSTLFKPLLRKMDKILEPPKARKDSIEREILEQLGVEKDVDVASSTSADPDREESTRELWNIWSSFISANGADSARTKMRFEHFYLLLFFLGLVASPDFDNSLGLSGKRILLHSADVETTWEKVYPLKGRAAALMDWHGFLEFLRVTGRRLKMTLAQILNYPTFFTNRGQVDEELAQVRAGNTRSHGSTPMGSRVNQITPGQATSENGLVCKPVDQVSASSSKPYAEDSVGSKEMATSLHLVPQAVRLNDGRVAAASARAHPCWVGTFSNENQSQAEKSGYHMQPLAMEADFLCVETNGVQGITRSTDASKALLMNPPPPKPSLIRWEEDLFSLRRSSSIQRIGSNVSRGMQRIGSNATNASRADSSTNIARVQSNALPNTWTEKDENVVRMLRMRKHIEFFGADAQPEDPANCIPCIDQILGTGPSFFRRKYLLGTEEHASRQREEWAAIKIQARVRGMQLRKQMRERRGIFAVLCDRKQARKTSKKAGSAKDAKTRLF